MKKQSKNLAWQGTTAEEKNDLLNESILLSEKLKNDGAIKDSYLSLASTCIDIINTTQAVRKTSDWNKEWEKLEKNAIKIVSSTIKKFNPKDCKDWFPSDFEVMAIILIMSGSKINLSKAQKYIEKGVKKSRGLNDKKSEALLFAKLLKIDIKKNDLDKLRTDIETLVKMATGITDPKVSTRIYRSIAESSKFLAIGIAEKAKLDNQVLKAKSI